MSVSWQGMAFYHDNSFPCIRPWFSYQITILFSRLALIALSMYTVLQDKRWKHRLFHYHSNVKLSFWLWHIWKRICWSERFCLLSIHSRMPSKNLLVLHFNCKKPTKIVNLLIAKPCFGCMSLTLYSQVCPFCASSWLSWLLSYQATSFCPSLPLYVRTTIKRGLYFRGFLSLILRHLRTKIPVLYPIKN